MLLAARNGVYGLTMARHLHGSLATRLVAAQLTIDESTAMATAQSEPRRPSERVLGDRCRGVRVLERRNAARRTRRLRRRPDHLRSRRRVPGRVRGDGRPAVPLRRQATAGLLGGLICFVTIPFVPVGMSILCAAAAVRRSGCPRGARPMTWGLVLTLAGWCVPVQGARAGRDRRAPAPTTCRSLSRTVPAALITALVVKDTVSTGQQLRARRPHRRGRRRRRRRRGGAPRSSR